MKQEKFKVLLYLKKSGLNKSGKAPVMGRITLNNSMVQFSTKLSCTPSLWNPRESRLDGKSREAVETNAKIDKVLLGVHSAFESLVERKKPFDAEAIKNLYQGSMDTQVTLLALLDRHMEGLKARVGIDCAPTTLATYKYTHRSLGKFIKKKFKAGDIAFGGLNEQFIREYRDFVLGELGYAMETVRHYLAILKKICKLAFKEGYSEKLHFAHYKLPKQKETAPKALSRESFEKIRDVEIPSIRPSTLFTRDLFLFACYTGTSYADVVRITGENLFTDEEGSLWLKYRRKKTDYRARVKLLPEAIALIEKYKDDNRETLFPMQSAEMVKANMKGLRVMANIKEPVTYHSGRHSFASLITLEEGVPIETISRMLGHSNIQTTQIYARVTPKKLFEDMDKLIEATSDLKLVL
ncbi:site-specific integrase [Dysgonomonas sp. Marseille-P4677]|uniref:site-specific integrase n=1 Tax=Dysgonomonas sp. Marseille-P4677 TaxID=2364790 RepID=UPI0019147F07|nr:site-specific integrase [Dysgonomonas sp. Marseille-P4677]MBK5722814.1 site-specific integrase [Dysgonomonas sp. Marseille-P4677]